MSEILNENPLIIGSFEKDGNIYPPVYEGCENCSYSGCKAEFNFSGPNFIYACIIRKKNVDNGHWCVSYALDKNKISDEAEEEIERLENLGEKLGNTEEFLTEKELNEYTE